MSDDERGTTQSSVSRFIACSRLYVAQYNRPPFYRALTDYGS
jgi:hypothetical protein